MSKRVKSQEHESKALRLLNNMKRKDKETLSKSDLKELSKLISDTRQELVSLGINQNTKPEKNSRKARQLRNKLAVLLTIFRQKELTK